MDGSRMPDDSLLQALWDEIRRLTETMQGGATLAQEIRESVFKIGDLQPKQGGDEGSALKEWMRDILQGRGILGATILGPRDEYENRSNPPTGFSELGAEAKEMLSAVTGIPQVILFGSTPEGLNTDGESAWQGFRQLVSDTQEDNRDNIERIYEVLYASQDGPTGGVTPPEWALTFERLDEPTEQQVAELQGTVATTDLAYIGAGVYRAEDVRARRFGAEGWTLDMGEVPPPPVEETVVAAGPGGAAQVQALVAVVQAVASSTLPRDAAQAIIARSFQVDPAEADALLGSAGRGFAIAAPSPAPAAPPLPVPGANNPM
jgi:phage-related protein (TIGR01555 family)